MRVTVEKTGGLAGVFHELGPVDSGDLPESTAKELAKRLAEIDFFNIPEDIRDPEILDDFNYELNIDDGDRHHGVAWNSLSPENYRNALADIIKLLEAAGERFVDWQSEGQPLDWEETNVSIPFVPGTPNLLSVRGSANFAVKVRLSPDTASDQAEYRHVHLLGVQTSPFGPDVVTPWEITASFDGLGNERGWFVLIGATKREYFPPKDL